MNIKLDNYFANAVTIRAVGPGPSLANLKIGNNTLFVSEYAGGVPVRNVGIGTATPNASAALDITSTNKGVLLPRMTSAQRNAIPSPAEGLLVYNLDCKELNYYNGTTWQSMSFLAPGALAASGSTMTSFYANWLPASSATTYFLDVSTSPVFGTFVVNNLNVGNVTTFNVTGLSCGTTYYYRVRAANACVTTVNSNTMSATTSICCSPVQKVVGGPGVATSNSDQTPFSTFWHDARTQYIITAAEMTAAGFCPGNLTALQLNVSTLGSPCMSGLTIKIKNTASATLLAFEGGTTQVYTNASYCPTTGWNNFTFSAPHYWDGTSNLLIEICFDNSGYSSSYGVYCDVVAANMAYGGYYDNITGACTYAAWSLNKANNYRPVFRFNGIGI